MIEAGTCSRCRRKIELPSGDAESADALCAGCLTPAEDVLETSLFAAACVTGGIARPGAEPSIVGYLCARAAIDNLLLRLSAADAVVDVDQTFAATEAARRL